MFVSKKKFEKLRSECDSWRATAEAYKRVAQENESLIAEGAKLADELADLRKARKAVSPVIDGMLIEYRDGSVKTITGCTEMHSRPYAPEGWLFAYAGDGLYLGQFATYDIKAITPVLIETKAVPKKKAVATKKAGRK